MASFEISINVEAGEREVIERYAAISRFLEILIRTESKVAISFPDAGAKISLKITSQTPPERFPQKILGVALNQLGDELDRFIEYKVKNFSKPAVNETQNVDDKIGAEHNLENEKPFDD